MNVFVFVFVFEGNLVKENTWLLWCQKRKASVFKLLWFEEHFWKALCLWQITVGGRPDHRNKSVLSNISDIKWMGLHFGTIVTNKLAKCVKDYVSKYWDFNLMLIRASNEVFLFHNQTFLKVFKRHQKENEALLKRYTKVSLGWTSCST